MDKKNFKIGDQVIFSKLKIPLTGYTGNILGIVSGPFIDSYIVSTNKAHVDGKTDQLAVIMPEFYLERCPWEINNDN